MLMKWSYLSVFHSCWWALQGTSGCSQGITTRGRGPCSLQRLQCGHAEGFPCQRGLFPGFWSSSEVLGLAGSHLVTLVILRRPYYSVHPPRHTMDMSTLFSRFLSVQNVLLFEGCYVGFFFLNEKQSGCRITTMLTTPQTGGSFTFCGTCLFFIIATSCLHIYIFGPKYK